MIFHESFYNLEQERKRNAVNTIKQKGSNTFLENDQEKLIDYFFEDFKIEKIEVDEPVGEINENTLILKIHFEGDRNLLRYSPTTCRMSHSYHSPEIEGKEIIYYFKGISETNETQLQYDFDNVARLITDNVANLNSDIEKFNVQLKELIANTIKNQIEEIKKREGILSKLNIKLKKKG